MVNGGLLQEKLIALNDGRYNPFRSFSIEELRTATNNYDRSRMFRSDGLGNWYKGCIENRVVSVYRRHYSIDEAVNDIAVAAQVGAHKNWTSSCDMEKQVKDCQGDCLCSCISSHCIF